MESLSLKCSNNMWLWHMRTWVSGEPGGGAGLMAGLGNLGGLFPP